MLRDLVLQPPPNLAFGLSLESLRELIKAASFFNRLRRLSRERLRVLLDVLTKPVAAFLEQWFDDDLVKSLFGFDAIVGSFNSPYAPGTAYGLLHHAFGEVNGKKRLWGHAIGGMGAVGQTIAKAAATHGVDIETNAPVREILAKSKRPPALPGWQ